MYIRINRQPRHNHSSTEPRCSRTSCSSQQTCCDATFGSAKDRHGRCNAATEMPRKTLFENSLNLSLDQLLNVGSSHMTTETLNSKFSVLVWQNNPFSRIAKDARRNTRRTRRQRRELIPRFESKFWWTELGVSDPPRVRCCKLFS